MSQIWGSPIEEKTRIDKNGFTHYVFSKTMFKNPYYVIHSNDVELFEKFIEGDLGNIRQMGVFQSI